MIRISILNLEKFSSLLGRFGKYPSYIDIDLRWIPKIIQFFSHHTDIPINELKKSSLYNLQSKISTYLGKDKLNLSKYNALWFTGWRKQYINGLRYCPSCLKEDSIPYYRKKWRLSYIPICIIHECFLENKCPQCNSPVAPYSLNWDMSIEKCYNCEFDLSQTEPKHIENSDYFFKIYKNFLNQKTNIEIIYKVLSLAWFIGNNYSFSDEIFNSHSLTQDEDLLELEKKASKMYNRKILFLNLKSIYLLIGTSIKIFQEKDVLQNFLKKDYSSIERFWTKKPFICPIDKCHLETSNYSNIKTHLKRHLDERKYLCKICNKKFFAKWDLEQHKKLHNLPYQFKCYIKGCKKEFRYKNQYIHHIRSIHKLNPYVCEICGYSTDRKYNLTLHMRIHTGKKPYKCEFCQKTFVSKGELNIHLQHHTGKKFECKICKKKLLTSQSLKVHMRIHTGERPYSCNICGKKFKRKHHLDSHLRIHTGEKPFICSICNKSFSLKQSLKYHLKIHSGERPFSCEKCGKKFRDKGNLKTHMTVHSIERPYKCENCIKSYKYKSSLNKHKKICSENN